MPQDDNKKDHRFSFRQVCSMILAAYGVFVPIFLVAAVALAFVAMLFKLWFAK